MIVAGFGFRREATVASLRDALGRTGAKDVTLLATASDKAVAPAFVALAQELALPVIPLDDLSITTLTNSAASRAARGTGSVAEAAALVAAGPGASLLGMRVVSADRMATCALATRNDP
ncbi:MAG: precorrin methylase [Cereibacter sphaeroides]|uniref:Precorrin methylase n=1 Tax=Cereibacter sphaeroides TaxID=1063 RepID=A0A2W5UT31_CERSP|nr:MAG: precorrin methylase [Cereibacter sphaeroides]